MHTGGGEQIKGMWYGGGSTRKFSKNFLDLQ
jgi:hypothetical protein